MVGNLGDLAPGFGTPLDRQTELVLDDLVFDPRLVGKPQDLDDPPGRALIFPRRDRQSGHYHLPVLRFLRMVVMDLDVVQQPGVERHDIREAGMRIEPPHDARELALEHLDHVPLDALRRVDARAAPAAADRSRGGRDLDEDPVAVHGVGHVAGRDEDVLPVGGAVVGRDETVAVAVTDEGSRDQALVPARGVAPAPDLVDQPPRVQFVQVPLETAALLAPKVEMAYQVPKGE